jgi:hypothetical protein
MLTRIESRSRGFAIRTLAVVLLAGMAWVHVLPVRAQSATPTEVFKAYRSALATASSFNELLPFMDANGRRFVEAMPDQQRTGMFELLKRFASTYSDVAVSDEKVTGNAAVLSLTGKDPRGQAATGTVPMTREDSGWKVGTEQWSSRPR